MIFLKIKAYRRLPSQLSIGRNLHRKGRRKHRAKARARARARSSRTKRRGGRNLSKLTFSKLNCKRKIINNLQEVDVQHALF
jgi:hypothetical protein